eukprot:GHVU01182499.1.p1 GENE.GHVU01182499.1~~GHVU01182499.1.p1  ORF type:complete len:452 (-),score=88.85 GHVU01182499.1:381-1736(-)
MLSRRTTDVRMSRRSCQHLTFADDDNFWSAFSGAASGAGDHHGDADAATLSSNVSSPLVAHLSRSLEVVAHSEDVLVQPPPRDRTDRGIPPPNTANLPSITTESGSLVVMVSETRATIAAGETTGSAEEEREGRCAGAVSGSNKEDAEVHPRDATVEVQEEERVGEGEAGEEPNLRTDDVESVHNSSKEGWTDVNQSGRGGAGGRLVPGEPDSQETVAERDDSEEEEEEEEEEGVRRSGGQESGRMGGEVRAIPTGEPQGIDNMERSGALTAETRDDNAQGGGEWQQEEESGGTNSRRDEAKSRELRLPIPTKSPPRRNVLSEGVVTGKSDENMADVFMSPVGWSMEQDSEKPRSYCGTDSRKEDFEDSRSSDDAAADSSDSDVKEIDGVSVGIGGTVGRYRRRCDGSDVADEEEKESHDGRNGEDDGEEVDEIYRNLAQIEEFLCERDEA